MRALNSCTRVRDTILEAENRGNIPWDIIISAKSCKYNASVWVDWSVWYLSPVSVRRSVVAKWPAQRAQARGRGTRHPEIASGGDATAPGAFTARVMHFTPVHRLMPSCMVVLYKLYILLVAYLLVICF